MSGQSWRYYRLYITGGSGVSMVGELELYEDLVNVALNKTATAEGYTSYPASGAFDGNPTTKWQFNDTLPNWIYVDLGSGVSKRISKYVLQGSDQAASYTPTAWNLQGSDDASTWTTIHSVSGATGWSNFERREWLTDNAFTVSGNVTLNGSPAARDIKVHAATGAKAGTLVGATTSSGSTGNYSVTVPYSGEVYVVMLDDAAGSVENHKVHRTTPIPL